MRPQGAALQASLARCLAAGSRCCGWVHLASWTTKGSSLGAVAEISPVPASAVHWPWLSRIRAPMLSGSSDRTHCRSVVELAARGQGPSGNSRRVVARVKPCRPRMASTAGPSSRCCTRGAPPCPCGAAKDTSRSSRVPGGKRTLPVRLAALGGLSHRVEVGNRGD